MTSDGNKELEKFSRSILAGRLAPAFHPRPLAPGGNPMFVEPAFGDLYSKHMIPDPNTGETDQQKFAQRKGTKPREGKREAITDPRIISELPPRSDRTHEELEKARQYFKNRKEEAKKRWEQKTGEI